MRTGSSVLDRHARSRRVDSVDGERRDAGPFAEVPLHEHAAGIRFADLRRERHQAAEDPHADADARAGADAAGLDGQPGECGRENPRVAVPVVGDDAIEPIGRCIDLGSFAHDERCLTGGHVILHSGAQRLDAPARGRDSRPAGRV